MMTTRGTLLQKARNITEGDRDEMYGDPKVQLSLAGELKAVVWDTHAAGGTRILSSGEREAIDMMLTKIARMVMGPKVTEDTYIDAAAYAAIAGECALHAVQQMAPEASETRHVAGAFTEVYAPSGRWSDKFTSGAQ